MRDLRDPQALGEMLLSGAASVCAAYVPPGSPFPLSDVYEVHVKYLEIPNYMPDEGTIAKYGDPTLIPHSTHSEVDGG